MLIIGLIVYGLIGLTLGLMNIWRHTPPNSEERLEAIEQNIILIIAIWPLLVLSDIICWFAERNDA